MLSDRNYKGFTLIEVLVTLAILAVGLLGYSGLMLTSLKYEHNSLLRSQAAFLAYEISDQIRANSAVIASYAYSAGTSLSPTDCSANSCTQAQLAVYNLAQWQNSLATLLPNSLGTIAVNGTTATITVGWQERNLANPQNATGFEQKSFNYVISP